MSKNLSGNVQGLKASWKNQLERLSERRMRQDVLVTPELASQLAELSRETGRALGALIDRKGQVTALAVGSSTRIYLPEIGRARGGGARFRGLRLVRTHLSGEALTRDDLADLSKLQLDAVVSVDVEPDGHAGAMTWAHLIPENPAGEHWRIEGVRHVSEADFSFADFIGELEAEFERKREVGREVGPDGAMLVYVRTRDVRDHEERVAELHELCRTAGIPVLETFQQSRATLDPRHAVGKGALEEVELRALQRGASLVVFGQDLTPAQLRGIAESTSLRVIDRTQLILDIFAQRAQSRGGKLQVELAQLRYRLPRLTGRGTAMSRLTGGIGGRGPGETKLETDRRRVRDRIRLLEEGIEALGRDRELRRKGRRDHGVPVVAIVGYTNAGKSTLLNTLTHSSVLAESKLFATLDPTSRRLRFPREREVVLTDTVGFIRDLPEELRQAFRATLEELRDAQLLVHMVDASDPAHLTQLRSTETILDELGLRDTARIIAWNKVDRLEPAVLDVLRVEHPDDVFLSASTRAGASPLVERIDRWLVSQRLGHLVPEARGQDSEETDPPGEADPPEERQ